MSLVISKEIPEMLAGHSGYLTGAYRRYDEETTAAEYLKAMHMVCITGSKQVKELENELKEKLQEQSVKTEKHADTMIQIITENMTLKAENKVMQGKMAEIDGKLAELTEKQNVAGELIAKLMNVTYEQWAEKGGKTLPPLTFKYKK
jgi:predicted nuclease with TOPRIM domain